MKYYIIAGEASGDLHGSNVMKAIKELDSNAQFQFWGGDKMLEEDDNQVMHIRETAIMGFVEVIKNFSKIKSFFKKAKATITAFQPDVIVFIDYPGFNLRMAKWAKKKGFKTVYYISPQLWAWKKGRIKTIQKYIDEMIVILPFEKTFYEQQGVKVHYVGHPLVPVIQEYIQSAERNDIDTGQKKILAILPGSRKQEIKKILPELVEAAVYFKEEYALWIGQAPNIEPSFYTEILGTYSASIQLWSNGSYDLLNKADIALVTSGTATLETALFKVPQVVCYKTSAINYEIGKRLVDLEYISLVNLIGDRSIVPELIQDEVNKSSIVKAINQIQKERARIIKDYNFLYDVLSIDNLPHTTAAEVILSTLKQG